MTLAHVWAAVRGHPGSAAGNEEEDRERSGRTRNGRTRWRGECSSRDRMNGRGIGSPMDRTLSRLHAEGRFSSGDRHVFPLHGDLLTEHDKLPDVVPCEEEGDWLYVVEIVTSHGPVAPGLVSTTTECQTPGTMYQ